MAVLKVRKFPSVEEVEFFLSGGIVGGATAGGVPGLVGVTLTFTKPSGTVTFVMGADTTGLSLAPGEIKAQIEAAIPALRVCFRGANGALTLREVTPAYDGGVVLVAAATNVRLGFSATANSVGKVFRTPEDNTVPCLVSAYADVQSNSHVVVTLE
jgi:hypothetical protein